MARPGRASATDLVEGGGMARKAREGCRADRKAGRKEGRQDGRTDGRQAGPPGRKAERGRKAYETRPKKSAPPPKQKVDTYIEPYKLKAWLGT